MLVHIHTRAYPAIFLVISIYQTASSNLSIGICSKTSLCSSTDLAEKKASTCSLVTTLGRYSVDSLSIYFSNIPHQLPLDLRESQCKSQYSCKQCTMNHHSHCLMGHLCRLTNTYNNMWWHTSAFLHCLIYLLPGDRVATGYKTTIKDHRRNFMHAIEVLLPSSCLVFSLSQQDKEVLIAEVSDGSHLQLQQGTLGWTHVNGNCTWHGVNGWSEAAVPACRISHLLIFLGSSSSKFRTLSPELQDKILHKLCSPHLSLERN